MKGRLLKALSRLKPKFGRPLGRAGPRPNYSGVLFDLSYEAVLGQREDFMTWADSPRAYLRMHVMEEPPVRLELGTIERREIENATLETFKFEVTHRGSSLPFSYDVDLAIPANGSSAVTMLLIHGHGLVAGESNGQIPTSLYCDPACYHGHGYKLLAQGRCFLAAPNVIHRPLARIAETYDYSVIWAGLAHQALRAIRAEGRIGAQLPVLGIAAGGHTAAALASVDPSVASLGVQGSFFPLDLLRRDFLLENHPDCYEFRAFMTYTTIFAMSAPRPLWLGIGREDALSLKISGAPPAPGFSGLLRGANSDELLGAALILQRIWSKFDAPLEICVNPGGHEDFEIERYLGWQDANSVSTSSMLA